MKHCILLFSGLFLSIAIIAQSSGPVIGFKETKHDFGKFKEEAGLQKYAFEFVNSGMSDLLISRVAASCGCTSPDWTKSPVKPGEKGYVEVVFNPANQRKFRKTVTVYSNAKPAVSVLIIEGDVIPRELTVDEIYRWPVGRVRFKSNHLAFTNVLIGQKRIRIMELINTSDQPVKIGFERVPAHLTLKAKPETLKPGEKGIIEGIYDGGKRNDWGYVNDLVRVVLNDEVQNNVYMVISANLTEDFSALSKADLENAPVMKFETTQFDFGEIPQNTKADVSFRFTNEGKRDLIIRKVRSSCGCTTVTPPNTVIKAGESSSIDAVFDAGVRQGKQHKVITVITNDPKNSQISLVVSGSVTIPGK